MQSKKRKILTDVFVLRPWGFVLFLAFGVGAFLFVSSHIMIPVYTTVETVAREDGGSFRLDLHQKEFREGTPVFLYQSRDDYLEKVEVYQVVNGFLLVDSMEGLQGEDKIYVDVQTDEISLLRHMFNL